MTLYEWKITNLGNGEYGYIWIAENGRDESGAICMAELSGPRLRPEGTSFRSCQSPGFRGRVIGDLPGSRASFENMTHPGICTAEFIENSAPDGDGRVHFVERFGKVMLDLTQGDLYDVEIQVSSDGVVRSGSALAIGHVLKTEGSAWISSASASALRANNRLPGSYSAGQ
jgi:hypothetical protein